MASSTDLVTITPAMLAMAWVKSPTLYYPGASVTGTLTAAEANATVDYLPNTLAESAGARGTGTAVVADPNYVFARTRKVNLEKTPYPTGSPDDISTTDIITPVECTPTLLAANNASTGQ
jgi:hypothetical protein